VKGKLLGTPSQGEHMFGHQNDQNEQQQDNQAMDYGVNAIVNNDVTPPASLQSFTPPSDPSTPTTLPADSVHGTPVIMPPADTPAPAPVVDTNNLIDIKQQALTQLSPLVGHLEQSPEEKFRTTMMMIQASDNQSLIKDAYEAAQQISDEKTRAQALLDVINEINYFTQHASAQA
jgi:hypothetical protein